MRELAEAGRPGAAHAGVATAAGTPRPRRPMIWRLATFVAERFPPLAYGPLIAAFVACGTTAALLATGERPALGWWTVAISLVVGAAFLQLRILDEIRDADIDRIGRPGRPVPRGLVTVRELLALAIGVGLVGGALAVSLGVPAAACYALATGTIWLLGTNLRRHNTGRYPWLREAIAHSAIAPLLILCAWASVAEIRPIPALAATLLLAWGASLAMEVSRKVVLPAEERDGVPTYSAELGRSRALLVAALAISAALAGAALLDAAVRGISATAVVPLAAAASAPVAVAWFGQRLGTGFIRTAAAILVLVALLWPVVVRLGLE